MVPAPFCISIPTNSRRGIDASFIAESQEVVSRKSVVGTASHAFMPRSFQSARGVKFFPSPRARACDIYAPSFHREGVKIGGRKSRDEPECYEGSRERRGQGERRASGEEREQERSAVWRDSWGESTNPPSRGAGLEDVVIETPDRGQSPNGRSREANPPTIHRSPSPIRHAGAIYTYSICE